MRDLTNLPVIWLTPAEVAFADDVARQRQEYNAHHLAGQPAPPAPGIDGSPMGPWAMQQQRTGCRGELAVARFYDVPWPTAPIGDYEAPDVPPFGDARGTTIELEREPKLILRRRDHAERRMMLVLEAPGERVDPMRRGWLRCLLGGWFWVGQGKSPQFQHQLDPKRKPAWAVPMLLLHDAPETLEGLPEAPPWRQPSEPATDHSSSSVNP